ncbi:MAG: universal stress protein [Acidimicrobiia bacterium]|nr:universal stress protein [Acidimicrobiia bacterium]
MQILVATAGALPPSVVTAYVSAFWSAGDSLVVMAAIEVPRTLLEELATEGWTPFAGERTTEIERAVGRYVEERGGRMVEPILSALGAQGMTARALYVEHADPAQAILETAAELSADLIVLGATRAIFKDDAWQSVAEQVMLGASVPMLLIPGQRRPDSDEDSEATDV